MIGYSADDHPQQREIVTNQLKGSKTPTVIGGDFNIAPGESTVKQIESLGYRTSQNEATTWKRMSYTTDHIFYNEKIKLISITVSNTNASDHNVLIAELEL
jgi:endonuclease/exonuclease/phosphatase (EEP) superfamily protein YafD